MMTLKRFIQVSLGIGFLVHTHGIGVGESKNVYYTGEFSEDVAPCPDFENNFMVLDLSVTTSDKDPSILVLKGNIELNGDITKEIMVSVAVCKFTIAGCELMYTAVGNACETLTDKTTPWYPLLAAFNREKCDITKGSFDVENLEISLDYVRDVLTHQCIGEYGVKVMFELDGEQISCYDLIVSIEEKQE